MGIIRTLDEQLANQIAAGEVVERPASVLKELLENAVDAGASRIEVAAEEGGLAYMRVADNGSGIAPEDLLPAFQRHATSKIATDKDLYQIMTLGFRGEALPSIASVAKVKCTSAVQDDGLGTCIEIEGGTIVRHQDVNASKGTEMIVRDLFYNTPARLKYMKTVQTELGHLSDLLYRQALARPDIAFTFTHNGNLLLRTPGNGELKQVIAAIYGTSSAKAMLTLQAESPDYTLTGMTAKPSETRANRNAITVLVNGRYIRSHAVVQPLLQAYHTLLPLHRYPLAVLNIRMHPSLVDVNVHPTKLEVRFSKENELRTFIEAAIKSALGETVHIPSGTTAKPAASKEWVQEQIRFQVEPNASTTDAVPTANEHTSPPTNFSGIGKEQQNLFAESRQQQTASGREQTNAAMNDRRPQVAERRADYVNQQRGDTAAFEQPRKDPPSVEAWMSAYAAPAVQPTVPAFPALSWVGQAHGTYIVAQNESGLYLIDQHAAHERIHYEYFFDKFGRPEEASQELLLPMTLEFAPDEYMVLKERLSAFERAGVYMEEFGGNTLMIRSVPHWFPDGDETAIVREMAEWVLNERSIDLYALREKAAILCACKASIKANQALTRESGEKLLERLSTCRQPYTCPHGRPIVVSFSTYELEKMFKRVMS